SHINSMPLIVRFYNIIALFLSAFSKKFLLYLSCFSQLNAEICSSQEKWTQKTAAQASKVILMQQFFTLLIFTI
ncbi:MAG: hypothetical protein ACI4SD_07715, partial [Suilimivivens sp.]